MIMLARTELCVLCLDTLGQDMPRCYCVYYVQILVTKTELCAMIIVVLCPMFCGQYNIVCYVLCVANTIFCVLIIVAKMVLCDLGADNCGQDSIVCPVS